MRRRDFKKDRIQGGRERFHLRVYGPSPAFFAMKLKNGT